MAASPFTGALGAFSTVSSATFSMISLNTTTSHNNIVTYKHNINRTQIWSRDPVQKYKYALADTCADILTKF